MKEKLLIGQLYEILFARMLESGIQLLLTATIYLGNERKGKEE